MSNLTIVTKLKQVLFLVQKDFSETQKHDIQTYINVGEWGLALETLSDFLYEEELPLLLEAYILLKEIGMMLQMDNKIWKILKPQIQK